MTTANKNIIYTAADIHQYLTGKLTPAEMHTIEKAALNDSLLAEAIEGFNTASFKNEKEFAQLQNQLNKLKKRIAGKPNYTISNNWWKVAAAVVFIVGPVFTLYKITSPKNNPTNIAATQKPAIKSLPSTNIPDSAIVLKSSIKNTTDKIPTISSAKSPVIIAVNISPGNSPQKNIISQQNNPSVTLYANNQRIFFSKKPGALNFSGKITDENSNPVPYTNIVFNHQQSKTDDKGFFNITTFDSSLELEIDAPDYYSKTVILHANDFQIISLKKALLKKDTSDNGTRLRSQVIVLYKQEAFPKCGWDTYLQYLITQLSYSEYDDGRPVTGQMIVEFKISVDGMPTDFHFDESIDEDVNNAIIQLLRNAPQWNNSKDPGNTGIIRLKIIF